ncbi:NUDIX hydrolase [Sphingomonas pseudosanguinis]|uniref:8-oxo-dGTP pyrophosphatase MutT (NUDIX family) n=1 Tax=Sphingomonas pseudosanguinis TaxID=413712 RepID=A0A7W6AAT6_9SPHN|nr:NUDIX domain-containing protein [Sphingomonas pseudosanguinis]MBB3878964.1 8-oxo-dGTP pyrophosphatase MutT (NUDIX family) [Sphingomonas pseudosanguinis]MBN3536705.1 NUDIX domain-containing protein [Sphingomonas pseudosanguinis]
MNDDPAIPDAIPAASLILIRDGMDPGDPPEILMVQRGATLAFLGGAMVFPGGRVDPADHALVPHDDPDPADTAAQIAAIRETIEEVGLAVGLSPTPDAATRAALCEGVRQGRALADVLRDHDLTIDTAALIPFARWCPEHSPVRRFDARFYLAWIDRDRSETRIDGSETVDARWLPAASALAQADAGRMRIIFPTRRTLERLALYQSFAAAAADAGAWPVRRIIPFLADRDGVPSICIPDDLGFPVTAEAASQAERG